MRQPVTSSSRVSNRNEIKMYAHCMLCFQEWTDGKAPGQSMQEYARLEFGATPKGVQLWCVRHNVNVINIDFEGNVHPATTSRDETVNANFRV